MKQPAPAIENPSPRTVPADHDELVDDAVEWIGSLERDLRYTVAQLGASQPSLIAAKMKALESEGRSDSRRDFALELVETLAGIRRAVTPAAVEIQPMLLPWVQLAPSGYWIAGLRLPAIGTKHWGPVGIVGFTETRSVMLDVLISFFGPIVIARDHTRTKAHFKVLREGAPAIDVRGPLLDDLDGAYADTVTAAAYLVSRLSLSNPARSLPEVLDFEALADDAADMGIKVSR